MKTTYAILAPIIIAALTLLVHSMDYQDAKLQEQRQQQEVTARKQLADKKVLRQLQQDQLDRANRLGYPAATLPQEK